MTKQTNKNYPYTVSNFDYNGFTGRTLEGDAPYKAAFKEWTRDPGIGVFKCSDDKERLIPTFAVKDEHGKYPKDLPKQTYEKGKLLYGLPAHS